MKLLIVILAMAVVGFFVPGIMRSLAEVVNRSYVAQPLDLKFAGLAYDVWGTKMLIFQNPRTGCQFFTYSGDDTLHTRVDVLGSQVCVR